jgi:hypothetical protein
MRARQRLCRAVFLAQGHQARHFGFGDIEFFPAKLGEGDIFDDVIGHEGVLTGVSALCRALSTATMMRQWHTKNGVDGYLA